MHDELVTNFYEATPDNEKSHVSEPLSGDSSCSGTKCPTPTAAARVHLGDAAPGTIGNHVQQPVDATADDA